MSSSLAHGFSSPLARHLLPAGLVLVAGLALSSFAAASWSPVTSSDRVSGEPITVTIGETVLSVPADTGSTTLVLPDGRVLTVTLEHPQAAQAEGPAVFEVVFVLDTTGSMSGLIEGAKQKIWAIASHIQQAEHKPEVRMGLVAYRDRGDDYVTRITPLTSDIDEVHANLMQFQAMGGGDSPESVNEALHRAFTEMQWSQDDDVVRLVYLVGDAPPKTYPDDVEYTTSVPQAKQLGITVHAIQCGNVKGTEGHWRAVALLGGGSYAQVEQSGGAVVIQTPYDEELAELNRELTATMIPYGTLKVQAHARGQMRLAEQLDDQASLNANADRAAFRAFNTHRMIGSGDLTTQLVENILTIEEIEHDLLPEGMQELGAEELASLIAERVDRRRSVQGRIAEIASKREAWIRERGAELGAQDGFDDFVARSIEDALRAPSGEAGPTAEPEATSER